MTLASIFETVPLDRITTEAREVRFGRIILTLLAGLFYGLGWVTAKVFSVSWRAMAWLATAVKVGWQEGRKKPTELRR